MLSPESRRASSASPLGSKSDNPAAHACGGGLRRDEHRDCSFTALAKLRGHVQQELWRQESFCDASSLDLLYLKTPKQPESVSCGTCVLIMIEFMATESVEAFYLLNGQC